MNKQVTCESRNGKKIVITTRKDFDKNIDDKIFVNYSKYLIFNSITENLVCD
ncbi:multiple sugar ABC transporter, ATP-binding protein [Spiroplasma clarkii]|nr:hypothetical protein [Spiroplasma clarkii]ARU91368.1 multiple sugar ABC transporter, ATP-binding protein [Spiroplasma clarkii]